MFGRLVKLDDHAKAAPTAAEIAAAVRKGSALQLLDREVAGMRERRQSLVDESRALIASRTPHDAPAVDRRLAEIGTESAALAEKILATRIEAEPLRLTYVTAVADALAASRRAAASRALAAIEELRVATRLLDEADAVIARAGGDVAKHRRLELDDAEHRARRLGAGR